MGTPGGPAVSAGAAVRQRSVVVTVLVSGGCREGGRMAAKLIVYLPDAQGWRRLRYDGVAIGVAHRPADIRAFLAAAGLENAEDVHLTDPDLVDWRGAVGPGMWEPRPDGASVIRRGGLRVRIPAWKLGDTVRGRSARTPTAPPAERRQRLR